MRNIIREVAPDAIETGSYFDDNYIKGYEDFNANLFIIGGRWISIFNEDTYNTIAKQAEAIIDGFYYHEYSYKECMIENDIAYNPHKCHLLKKWAENADASEPGDIAKFLTITTGKLWIANGVSGYSQGDYVEVLYCADCYTSKQARIYAEVWLGCCKEFCVIDLDENGNETDSCYGYIVADSEAWHDEDYKKIVCDWAGIDENETILEMIDGQRTYTEYIYRSDRVDFSSLEEEKAA